jgi:hypothetical protein
MWAQKLIPYFTWKRKLGLARRKELPIFMLCLQIGSSLGLVTICFLVMLDLSHYIIHHMWAIAAYALHSKTQD